jgi:hypothetical protein
MISQGSQKPAEQADADGAHQDSPSKAVPDDFARLQGNWDSLSESERRNREAVMRAIARAEGPGGP